MCAIDDTLHGVFHVRNTRSVRRRQRISSFHTGLWWHIRFVIVRLWVWPRPSRVHVATTSSHMSPTTATIVLQPFVRDYPGELLPEETFTQPPSWSLSNFYQLLLFTMIHSILTVQIACVAIFLRNLCPFPFWSTSWSAALHLIFHTFLHPISVFFSQHMPYLRKLFCCSINIISSTPSVLVAFSDLILLVGRQEGHSARKNMREWWRWALISPDGVAPSRMVSVSASVNLPLHHKV